VQLASDPSFGQSMSRVKRALMDTITKPRRGPGRPKDTGELRMRIVDSAELAFAEFGYAGAKLRDIAADA
jgi:AcrR family transcriptional regulator